MKDEYILFFSHTIQIKWFSPIALEIKDRLGMQSVIWVIGEQDRSVAESTGHFDAVVDLLHGFKLDDSEREYASNLAYLSAFEKRIGKQFYHEDVAIDRHVSRHGWSDAKIAQYAVHLLKSMEQQLGARGGLPLAAFGENNTLPYRLAHRLIGNRPYWYFGTVRHWDHRLFLDDGAGEQWPECRRLYKEYRQAGIPAPLYNLAKEKLYDVRKHQIQPFYYSQYTARGNDDVRQKLQLSRVKRVLDDWRNEIKRGKGVVNPQTQTGWQLSPINKVKQTSIESYRKQFFDKLVYNELPNTTGFASYFMQTQPEYCVEGFAFEFRDQVSLIENIAAFLPADLRLVVKEHKTMIGLRDTEYYKRLTRIPNVVLLTDKFKSYELIKRSRIVFTLTSTAALEAIYEGVPAIVFGDIFFDGFEGIYKVNSIKELRATTWNVLTNPNSGASEDAAVAVLAAMYVASFPGKFESTYPIEEIRGQDNAKSIVEAAERELASQS